MTNDDFHFEEAVISEEQLIEKGYDAATVYEYFIDISTASVNANGEYVYVFESTETAQRAVGDFIEVAA